MGAEDSPWKSSNAEDDIASSSSSESYDPIRSSSRQDFFSKHLEERLNNTGSIFGIKNESTDSNKKDTDNEDDDSTSKKSKKTKTRSFLNSITPDAGPKDEKPKKPTLTEILANQTGQSVEQPAEFMEPNDIAEESQHISDPNNANEIINPSEDEQAEYSAEQSKPQTAENSILDNQEDEAQENRASESVANTEVEVADYDQEDVVQNPADNGRSIDEELPSVLPVDSREQAEQAELVQRINSGESQDASFGSASAESTSFGHGGESEISDSQTSERVVEKHETKVRTGGALVAFLGANYLSRRRVNKAEDRINKDQRLARENIDHLNKRQLSSQEAVNRLAQHQEDEISRLKRRVAENDARVERNERELYKRRMVNERPVTEIEDVKMGTETHPLPKRPTKEEREEIDRAYHSRPPVFSYGEKTDLTSNVQELGQDNVSKSENRRDHDSSGERMQKTDYIETKRAQAEDKGLRTEEHPEDMHSPESISNIMASKHETLTKDRRSMREEFGSSPFSASPEFDRSDIFNEAKTLDSSSVIGRSQQSQKASDDQIYANSVAFGVATALFIIVLGIIAYLAFYV